MAELTDDLISDILSRLPVKSLLRFRCVSKTWYALINSNNFVKQHLDKSIKTKINHTLIFGVCNLYSSSPYSLDQAVELLHPLKPSGFKVKLLGSCNGLLCLLLYKIFDDHLVVIWNPATRKHIKLPTFDTIEKSMIYEGLASAEHVLIYGFGYDLVSDDYKVVMLLQFFIDGEETFIAETNIYSLRLNSWRIIEDVPDYLIDNRQGPGALVCGTIHWIGGKRESEFEDIVYLVGSFDLVREEYNIVTLPEFSRNDIPIIFVLELGGCLSVVCNYGDVNGVDVWVMKDYGVRESWTKLLTLSCFEINRSVDFVIPLAYSESGDEVVMMLNSANFLFYNLVKKRVIKLVDFRCGHNTYFNPPVICLGSLVSLGGEAEIDEKEEVKEERQEKFLSVGFKLVL